MTTLEGWATKISAIADHTYVYCPSNGKYFDCWGGHEGPDNRKICSGNGIYEVANCYRCNVGTLKDTACIGVYGAAGVCHQSANCFLFSAGTVLTLAVRGYWFTSVFYGIWGADFLDFWFPFVYMPCLMKHDTAPHGKNVAPPPRNEGNELFEKIQKGHEGLKAAQDTIHPHDVIVKDAATLALHAIPDLDVSAFEDRHRRLLGEKDELIGASTRAKDLVSGINGLSIEFQKEMSDHFTDKGVTPELYQKLTGLAPGETVKIIDPEIAEKAADHIEEYLEKMSKK